VRLLRAPGERPLVIGHRGAAAVAPENSMAALEAAIAVGADLVEFDVGPDLRLAHSADEAAADAPTLDEALDLLAAHPIGLHVDVKAEGYEAEILAAVGRHTLADRVVVSTAWAASARTFAALAPELPVAIGYPRDRYGVSRFRWPETVTRFGAASLTRALPARVPFLLRAARANALSLHHALCSASVVACAHRRGAPVLAWTANDPRDAERLAQAGVDAIVSDDPARMLDALATLFPL
jgi:glycerophosphoryl diester phosphodiesterase